MLPLSGLVVADFSRVLAGPLATMFLGDLGADVIKVERPEGDDVRRWGPPFAGEDSVYFSVCNRNKRSLVLDLKVKSDLEMAVELADRADVLVENFRPGAMDRLGLGYADLRERNPRLVYCSISGFGTGGGAHMPGYDFLVQATGGLMSITGPSPSEPTKVGVAVVDVLAALHATIGVLAALAHREQTGTGQRVEVNLLSSLLASLVNQAATFLSTGESPVPMGNQHPSVAPYELLRVGDRSLALAVGNDRQFMALAQVLQLPELATDPRFATNSGRITHRSALTRELERLLQNRNLEETVSALIGAGVPAGFVQNIEGAFDQARTLGLTPTFTWDDQSDGVPQISNPIGFSDLELAYLRPPPLLGQHNEEIREWLRPGYHDAQDDGGGR
jgi:crotonobetainyl-CoA:carnitine CoA-transferase CaiB-like acyl-CoA transferase